MRPSRTFVGLIAALALAGVVAGCGHDSRGDARTRVEDRRTGIALMLPHGWRMRDDPPNGSGAMMLATYPIAHLGDLRETPPKGETWLLLYDYGPLWTLPGSADELRPLPSRLPAEDGYAEFGTARLLDFRSRGHHFTAYVKGNPRSAATLGILHSIHITPFGRSLALVIKVHTVDGVQVWRVGNPRSRRRLIVVGCPGLARDCSGFAVTQRLINGPAALTADLWVIQLLRGREDVLARLERRLRPAATIRLGTVRDPSRCTNRIVALAR